MNNYNSKWIIDYIAYFSFAMLLIFSTLPEFCIAQEFKIAEALLHQKSKIHVEGSVKKSRVCRDGNLQFETHINFTNMGSEAILLCKDCLFVAYSVFGKDTKSLFDERFETDQESGGVDPILDESKPNHGAFMILRRGETFSRTFSNEISITNRSYMHMKSKNYFLVQGIGVWGNSRSYAEKTQSSYAEKGTSLWIDTLVTRPFPISVPLIKSSCD